MVTSSSPASLYEVGTFVRKITGYPLKPIQEKSLLGKLPRRSTKLKMNKSHQLFLEKFDKVRRSSCCWLPPLYSLICTGSPVPGSCRLLRTCVSLKS